MLAIYEKRSTALATPLTLMIAILVALAAVITTLVLDPITVWSDDRFHAISAGAISGIWSRAFSAHFAPYLHSDFEITTASGAFIAAVIASFTALFDGDVLKALGRAATYAGVASGPAIVVCYAITIRTPTTTSESLCVLGALR